MATSGTFGVVQTADDGNVTQWEWEESADGVSWDVVGTILTNVSGQGTTELTVNAAPLTADGTQVRCRAYYSINGGGSTLSNPASLEVLPV